MKNFILEKAGAYKISQTLFGADDSRKVTLKKLRLHPGDRVLDIGCGPAKVLEYLPKNIEYIGFDDNPKYIDDARNQYGDRGKFFCATIGKHSFNELGKFNVVLALGVLHHLNDGEALELFEIAHNLLLPGGILLTLDGCFTENQSLVRKFVLHLDRGRFVRKEDEYIQLGANYFQDIKSEIHENLFKIPYTAVILECVK